MKSNNQPSLIKSLNRHFIFLIFVVISIAAFVLYKTISEKEMVNRIEQDRALGLLTAKTIERSLSLGDFIAIEGVLNSQKYPHHIQDITIWDKEGNKIASYSKRSDFCFSIKQTMIPIGSFQSTGQIAIKSSFCDLELSNQNLIGTMVLLSIALILVLSLSSRNVIRKSFEPLLQANSFFKNNEVQKDFLIKAPTEILPLLLKLDEAYEEHRKYNNILYREKIANQVAHDIRSPLAGLEMASLNLEDKEQAKIIKSFISQIKGIADNLLIRSHMNMFKSFDLNEIIEDIICQKRTEYKHDHELQIVYSESTSISLEVEEISFRRILSNLINNSIEAYESVNYIEKTIHITCRKSSSAISITVSDNGAGIHELLIPKILSGKSYKYKGYGLGLSSANETIKNWGGELKLESLLGKGTSVTIILPLKDKPSFDHTQPFQAVHLDDDIYLRQSWEIEAKKKGLHLLSLSSFEELEKHLSKLCKTTPFYIDSNLGNDKGELIAEGLYKKGFINLNLSTGYEAQNFARYSFLKSIIGKKAPWAEV